jgi:membrane protein
LKEYVFSVIMVLVMGAFILATLAASTALALMTRWFRDVLPHDGYFWQGLDFLASLTLVTLLFLLTYRLMSDRRIGFGDIWPGAVVGAALFTAGKMLFGLYLAYTSPASGYGAAGSLVVLLLWVYYSAQSLLFGAELIQARLAQPGPTPP